MKEIALESIPCPFCPSAVLDQDPIVITENGYSGRKCETCGMIRISPRPIPAEIAGLYREEHAQRGTATHLWVTLAKRLHNRLTLRIIERYRRGRRLLEIGAGGGSFAKEAVGWGFDVCAVEMNPALAAQLRLGVGIACYEELRDVPEQPGFDVIYHCDVLSHFPDQISTFRHMHSLLGNDGLLVFETGNLGDVDLAHLSTFTSFQYPDHLFFHSTRSLARVLEASGFKVERMYRYSLSMQLALQRVKEPLARSSRNFRLARVYASTCSKMESELRPSRSAPFLSRVLRAIGECTSMVLYVATYKLGCLPIDIDRPQTLIVVAKKYCCTA